MQLFARPGLLRMKSGGVVVLAAVVVGGYHLRGPQRPSGVSGSVSDGGRRAAQRGPQREPDAEERVLDLRRAPAARLTPRRGGRRAVGHGGFWRRGRFGRRGGGGQARGGPRRRRSAGSRGPTGASRPRPAGIPV
jgi:hypothetical protein